MAADGEVSVGLALAAWLSEEVDLESKRRCDLCGEPINWENPNCEAAEMWDPTKPDENSVICHADCGLNAGLELA